MARRALRGSLLPWLALSRDVSHRLTTSPPRIILRSECIWLLAIGALENVLKSLNLLLGQVRGKRNLLALLRWSSGLLGHLEELLKLLIIDASLLVIGWRDIHAGSRRWWRRDRESTRLGMARVPATLPIVLSTRSVRPTISIPARGS